VNRTGSSFGRSERWQHIKEVSCRTDSKVGPGCYNSPISTNKGKSVKIMKDLAVSSLPEGEFIYVGSTILKRERPTSRGNITFRSTIDSLNKTGDGTLSPMKLDKSLNFPTSITSVRGNRSIRPLSVSELRRTYIKSTSKGETTLLDSPSPSKDVKMKFSFNSSANGFYNNNVTKTPRSSRNIRVSTPRRSHPLDS